MTAIVLKLLVEMLKGLVAKVAWKVVAERFLSRFVVYALRKLASMSSNSLVQGTVDDIVDQLARPENKLPRVREQDQLMRGGK